jgi:hypothetical protein
MIHKISWQWLPVIAAVFLIGCSSTTLTGSWKSPDFQGQISKVYLVGISKSETNRHMYESQFSEELKTYGVTGIPSYKDIPDAQNASKATIEEQMKKSGADSMLITRLVGTRIEEVMVPGRLSGYQSGPGRGYVPLYTPAPHYRYWGGYYDRCCVDLIYEPPMIARYEVVTIEANLYEAKSGELIWSAQLETIIESDLQKLVSDFVQTVARDLHEQRLI